MSIGNGIAIVGVWISAAAMMWAPGLSEVGTGVVVLYALLATIFIA